MNENKIKPCPFCGKLFSIVEYPEDGTAHWKHISPDCPMHRDNENGYLYENADGLVEELNQRFDFGDTYENYQLYLDASAEVERLQSALKAISIGMLYPKEFAAKTLGE